MRVLPDSIRDLLKEPIGPVVNEKKLLEILEKRKYVVSVGDQVTYTLLEHGIEPVFCVVDFKTRRGKCSDEIVDMIKSFGKKTVIVDNPQGCISDDLWNVIKYAYENLEPGSLRIEVRGEEDMASLAAIYHAPEDVTIIYGLPDKGVLVVIPTRENKEKVKEVLDMM